MEVLFLNLMGCGFSAAYVLKSLPEAVWGNWSFSLWYYIYYI